MDLITFYFLAIGTLLASCGLTYWEHRTQQRRSRELKILAAGYLTLAVGCTAASFRHDLPGALGSALSNVVIEAGYLLVLHGVAALSGRHYRGFSIGLGGVLALVWIVGGARWQDAIWNFASALPIAIASGMTARELAKSDGNHWGQARRIAVIVSGVHGVFYAARACVLPWVAASFGPHLLPVVGKITMYEGVLYSVILPMTLLRLVRDEAHAELLRESTTDYLTGLGNRRWFFEEGARAIREGAACVLAIDLDQFKTINDRHGHHAGDEVLKSFARVARSVLGRDAVLARIGGEEFAAVLLHRDGQRARALGDAIVGRFAHAVSFDADAAQIRATVSIGLALSDADGAALPELLASADRALYAAKSAGGNRLVVAGEAVASVTFA